MRLTEDHPILTAQRRMNTIISASTVDFGVYSAQPCNTESALLDIRYLAQLFFSIRSRSILRRELDPNLTQIYLETDQAGVSQTETGQLEFLAPDTASSTATSIAVAIDVLESVDVETAGRKLHWLLHKARPDMLQATVQLPARISKTLAAAKIKAAAPSLNAQGTLRYRAVLAIPQQPDSDAATAQCVAASLPTLVWPAVAAQTTHTHRGDMSAIRQALACATLIASTRISLLTARSLLRSTIPLSQISLILERARREPSWPQTAATIIHLHDYLLAAPAPIDYTRRRQLDYRDLLSPTTWSDICEHSQVLNNGLTLDEARRWLVEILSGLPEGHLKQDTTNKTNSDNRSTALDNSRHHPTVRLRRRLRAEAAAFLIANGIDEPITWKPPNTALHGHIRSTCQPPSRTVSAACAGSTRARAKGKARR